MLWNTFISNVGEIKNNKYNGKRSYLYINGNVYIGDFTWHEGVFTYVNGDKYEGLRW